jgi:hypothetical protein
VQQLLHPSRPIGEVNTAPLSTLGRNLALLAQPSSYYWLSFARHGTPLAPLMARLHPVLTPAVQAAWLAGLVAAAIHRDRLRLFVLAAPAVLVLAWIMPSDGLWRFHLLSPLVCLGAAFALTAPSDAARAAAVTLAAHAGATAILPASRMTRQLWLHPGRWAVEVAASGPAIVALDGRVLLDGDARAAETTVSGWVHRLSVEMPRGGDLKALGFRWLDR